MAVGDSDLSIGQQACTKAGITALFQQLGDEDPAAIIINAHYERVAREGFIRYHWPWCTEWYELTYVGESDNPMYASDFHRPKNIIGIRSVWYGGRRITDWDVTNRAVRVDLLETELPLVECAIAVSEDNWDPLFVSWMVTKMAALVATGVRRDAEMGQMFEEEAHVLLKMAKFHQSKQRTPRRMPLGKIKRIS